MRRLIAIVAAMGLTALSAVPAVAGVFDNPNYTYTQIWSGGEGVYARWADYNATNGKILWRDSAGNGYVGDFDTATGAITNQVMFASAGTGTYVYEASFSVDGTSIFYQNIGTTTSLDVNGTTLEAYLCQQYDLGSGTTQTVFDISTCSVATIEALTGYAGNSEFGFYMSQGGSGTELLMSVRDATGNMEVVKYDIVNKTFTNLTNDAQANYDGQYLGSDTSKLLYWTESYPDHSDRGVSILEGGVETVIDTQVSPDMNLSARWGADHDHVMVVSGTDWGASDLYQFSLVDGVWVREDLTGDGWGADNGGIYAGASIGDNFLFGVRSDSLNEGLWYARAVPEPTTLAIWTIFGACGAGLAARRKRRQRA